MRPVALRGAAAPIKPVVVIVVADAGPTIVADGVAIKERPEIKLAVKGVAIAAGAGRGAAMAAVVARGAPISPAYI